MKKKTLKQMYGFAFVKNLSSQILYKLENINCCYLVAGKSSIDKYLEFLIHEQPENIIGMGVYYRKNFGKIRIETICTNKLKGEFHSSNKLIEYNIKPFIKENQNFTTPKTKQDKYKIGDSYCNYVSFKIMELIQKNKLSCKYTFLHIPKKLRSYEIASLIDKKLKTYLANTENPGF